MRPKWLITTSIALFLSSCGIQNDMAEETFSYSVSDDEISVLKEELKQLANANELRFVDGSEDTSEAREIIDRRFVEIYGEMPRNDIAHTQIMNVVLEFSDRNENFVVIINNVGSEADHVDVTFVFNGKDQEQRRANNRIKSGIEEILGSPTK